MGLVGAGGRQSPFRVGPLRDSVRPPGGGPRSASGGQAIPRLDTLIGRIPNFQDGDGAGRRGTPPPPPPGLGLGGGLLGRTAQGPGPWGMRATGNGGDSGGGPSVGHPGADGRAAPLIRRVVGGYGIKTPRHRNEIGKSIWSLAVGVCVIKTAKQTVP